MKIVIGKPFEHHTNISSESQHATLVLDKGDRAGLALGADLVRVFHTLDRGWVIQCPTNVIVESSPQKENVNDELSATNLHKLMHGR